MNENLEWLPELVLFEDYNGNWENYLNAIYHFFVSDFVKRKPFFQGTKLALKKHPIVNGKEATFWHIISTGESEADRVPDFRRCERIRWPKPVIESDDISVIKIWKNKRNSDTRICLWVEPVEYLVILSERKGYILLWTAYLVTQNHRKRKLQKEYEAYIKAKATQ